MENKLLLFGIFFALFQAAVYGKRNESDPSINDGSLRLNIDDGKERDSFISLAKLIKEKQSLTDNALKRILAKIEAMEERMAAKIKAMEERMIAEAKAIEERWNQRIIAEDEAIEERCNRRMAAETQETEQIWKDNNRDVATPQKRPAELACEKITNDLRSIGGIDLNGATSHIYITLYTSYHISIYYYPRGSCYAIMVDRRFLLTAAYCLGSYNYTKVELNQSVQKGVKAVHKYPDFSSNNAYLNNIALIELDSDLDYTAEIHPACLYASQLNPESDLEGLQEKIEIVADAECFKDAGTDLKPSQICAKGFKYAYGFSGFPMYVVENTVPKYKLFGIVATDSNNFSPFLITKVFEHLDFIEGIVWPRSGN